MFGKRNAVTRVAQERSVAGRESGSGLSTTEFTESRALWENSEKKKKNEKLKNGEGQEATWGYRETEQQEVK